MFMLLAFLVFLSGLIINPWAGRLYRGMIINYRDVMLNYFISATVISVVVFGMSLISRRLRSKTFEKLTVLLITCMLIVLSDRALLAWFGLPLWVADMKNHFRHRPNIIRTWGPRFGNKLIRINRYGYHDDNFPLEKSGNEFRGLMLGDSITMGHGVTYEETFSHQLENILKEKHGNRRPFKIINTGVQGYSTFQEYNVLLESLVFKPDFVAIGFCMNDPVEPFVTDKRFGGLGSDYHGITQVSSQFTSYILNDTGYGRWVNALQERNKSVESEKRWQLYSVKELAGSSYDNPQFSKNWKVTLSYLDKIYDVARNHNIGIVLLIFPNTFQLMNHRLQGPQKILIEHAKSKDVDVIDFTKAFETLVFDGSMGKTDGTVPPDGLYESYRVRIRKFFLDDDHFTNEGHKEVASQIYSYLLSKYSF